MKPELFQTYADKIIQNCSRVIVGKEEVIRQIIVSFLCGGHVLLEDVPAPVRLCCCALLPSL